jgi:hypothetical protein
MFRITVRRIHLYTALFLSPWMLAFALSNISMNHKLHTGAKFEFVREEAYPKTFGPTDDKQAVAKQILADLQMPESFWIDQRRSNDDQLTVVHDSPLHAARITYSRSHQKLVIKKKIFRIGQLMESFHRGGFGSTHLPKHIWGILVDGLTIGMILWAFSGFLMWWELKITRRVGFVTLAMGCILFLVTALSL